jgi:16S rRNA C1402 N4-methylase RsmH
MQWVGEAERTEKGIPSTPLPLRPFGARAIDPEQLKQRQIQNLIYDYAGEEMRNKVRYDFERAYLKYRKNKTPENRAKLDQAAQRLSKEQIQNIINEIENPPTSADRLKNAAKRVPKALRPELNRELQKLQSK